MKETIAWILAAVWAAAFLVVKVDNVRLDSELSKIKSFAHQQEVEHAKKLATATDSILVASREYDVVRSERDVLSRKLLDATRRSREADSLGACAARIASLEAMVRDLHGLAEKCDAGWHGCASRKDALSEVVK